MGRCNHSQTDRSEIVGVGDPKQQNYYRALAASSLTRSCDEESMPATPQPGIKNVDRCYTVPGASIDSNTEISGAPVIPIEVMICAIFGFPSKNFWN